MDTTLTPIITPAEAFARAREDLDAHEAILPALNEHIDPVIGETHHLIVVLLRAQITAAEAIIALTPEADAAFSAGYTTGLLTQVIESATGSLAKLTVTKADLAAQLDDLTDTARAKAGTR